MKILNKLLDEKEPPNPVVTLICYLLVCLPTVLVIVLVTTCLEDYSGFAFTFDTDEYRVQWQTWNWHPVLMTFAFMTMFGAGALAYKRLPFSHGVNKVIHMVCQTVALVSATLAIVVVHLFKKAAEDDELYTPHAWVGFCTYLMFCIQYVVGFASFALPPPYPPVSWRKVMHPVHVGVGCLLLPFASISIVSGVMDRLWIFDCYDAGALHSLNPVKYFAETPLFGSLHMVGCLIGVAVVLLTITVMSHHVGKRSGYQLAH